MLVSGDSNGIGKNNYINKAIVSEHTSKGHKSSNVLSQ